MTEADLFDYLKRYFFSDLEKTKDEYDCFDCISKRHKQYIELKCRRKHYENLMIEKFKYDNMVQKAGEIGFKPVYINSTPQGIWGFDILKMDIRWDKDLFPKQTDFAQKEKIDKVIGYLHIPYGEDMNLPF